MAEFSGCLSREWKSSRPPQHTTERLSEDSSVQPLSGQVAELFILAIPVASIAWTVTHEEIFREPREWCTKRSKTCQKLLQRKFFYLFTCEYCFSHYVTLLFLFVTGFKLLLEDWRGYVVAGFSLVWVANVYMSLFGRIRLDIKRERIEIETKEIAKEQATEDETTPQKPADPPRSAPSASENQAAV